MEYLHYTDKVGKFVYESKLAGKTNREIIEELEYMYDKRVSGEDGRQIRRWHERYKREHDIGGDIATFINRYNSLVAEPPSPNYSILQRNNVDKYNLNIWRQMRQALVQGKREIKIAVPNDIHFPFENRELLEKFYKVIDVFQPDIVIAGSDAFDGPNISKFTTSVSELSRDYVKCTIQKHRAHIDTLRYVCKNAIIPYISDNHGIRFVDYLMHSSPQIGDYVMDHFMNDLTYGDVLFLGWEEDAIMLFSENHRRLTIAHGNRTTKQTAESTFLDYFSDFLVIGHVHRVTEFIRTIKFDGTYETIRATSTGCLCDLKPGYHKSSSRSVNWQAGFGLVRFDTQNGNCQVDNIIANPEDSTFYWGDRKY